MRLNEKQWEREAGGGSGKENHSEGVYSVRLDALQVFLNQYSHAREKSQKSPPGAAESQQAVFHSVDL